MALQAFHVFPSLPDFCFFLVSAEPLVPEMAKIKRDILRWIRFLREFFPFNYIFVFLANFFGSRDRIALTDEI